MSENVSQNSDLCLATAVSERLLYAVVKMRSGVKMTWSKCWALSFSKLYATSLPVHNFNFTLK